MTVFLQPFFVNVRSSSECSLSFLDRFSFWSGQCRHFRLRGTRITFPALLGNDFCVRTRRFGEPRCFVREALRSLTRSRIRFCWYFKCADSRILSNVSLVQVRFTCADGERLQFDVERRLRSDRSFSVTPRFEEVRKLVDRKDSPFSVSRYQLGSHAIE
jgi:hypothetical protein